MLNARVEAQTGHTDRADFDASLIFDEMDQDYIGGLERTLDFDSLMAGDPIASGSTATELEGFQFVYDLDAGAGNLLMQVSDGGDDSTPNSGGMGNTLGTNDAGIFQDGDMFGIVVPPSYGFGIEIISRDSFLTDVDGADISLNFNAGGGSGLTVDLDENSGTMLADGSTVYFLGVTSGTDVLPGTEATITTRNSGNVEFLFNVDCLIRGEMIPGDCDLNGSLNALDIDPFIDLLVTAGYHAACGRESGRVFESV